MSSYSRISVFCSALVQAMCEGLRKIPLWAVLVQATVIVCCILRPEVVLALSLVLTVGTILKAGKFNDKYSKGLKKLPVDEDEDEKEDEE